MRAVLTERRRHQARLELARRAYVSADCGTDSVMSACQHHKHEVLYRREQDRVL
jgi:hypothetical protein